MTHATPHRIRRPGLHGALVILVTALLISACGSRSIQPSEAALANAPYHLGPGDEVNVNVFGDESLSGVRKLDGGGAFTLPLVGAVEANGMTSSELEKALQERLKTYLQDPRVTVEIISNRPFYIVGEVRRPGSYAYVNGMNVINAVAIAGGFTYRAREDTFVIQRKSTNAPATVVQTTPVMPGDVIVVHERFF